ncbi:phytanoyl-CoA dioxygenase family protein [Commensalibacter oyaizuii]|uniref:Phytanoyl-CoA dioxygenase family protein n=1 Tax=Commensalibacter oyaizuii TaxID=3043873 RepID=A0ABT6Q136_9PROT|nr:phytanoyl-CoA dioxygenase family protein [Commensalibacter sp. TBRC 16381]MDI2090823.1 phytanoyl-CoA dioxygenase family protein [Commensalibacter sp. TBRC 16381]
MLTNNDIEQFHKDGFLVKENYVPDDLLHKIDQSVKNLELQNHDGYVFENDQKTLRSINGPHMIDPFFEELANDDLLERDAYALLNEETYLHQYKINFKNALNGDVWAWHSDFYFWNKEDGMQKDNAFSVGIFLDDVNDMNGPLLVAPGSHKTLIPDSEVIHTYGQNAPKNWRETTSSKLKYELSQSFLAKTLGQTGIVAAKGKKGSALFFHSSILHASNVNLTPWRRRLVLLSYNVMSNKLLNIDDPRPNFMATR